MQESDFAQIGEMAITLIIFFVVGWLYCMRNYGKEN